MYVIQSMHSKLVPFKLWLVDVYSPTFKCSCKKGEKKVWLHACFKIDISELSILCDISALSVTFILFRFVRLFKSQIGTESFDFLEGHFQSQKEMIYKNGKKKQGIITVLGWQG